MIYLLRLAVGQGSLLEPARKDLNENTLEHLKKRLLIPSETINIYAALRTGVYCIS